MSPSRRHAHAKAAARRSRSRRPSKQRQPSKSPPKRAQPERTPKSKRAASPKRAADSKRAVEAKHAVKAKRAALRVLHRRKPSAGAGSARGTSSRGSSGRGSAKFAAAFSGATDSASSRQRVLFELVRARTALHAAIQGLTGGAAERPMADGKWSVREVVLHLIARDRARLKEFEAALRGVRASWADLNDEQQARLNAEHLATLRQHGWDDAVRLLHATRRELLEALESVPDEPAEVWSPEHSFGWMMHALPSHDRHHADQIKHWRAEQRV